MWRLNSISPKHGACDRRLWKGGSGKHAGSVWGWYVQFVGSRELSGSAKHVSGKALARGCAWWIPSPRRPKRVSENMKQTYITSVSSDNLSNENICGWIISPLLMQKWGEALHFSLADLTSYLLSISLSLVSFFRSFSFLFKTFLSHSYFFSLWRQICQGKMKCFTPLLHQ